MAGTAPEHTGRAATILRPGGRAGADVAARLPSRLAPGRGVPAVPSTNDPAAQTPRDRHIRLIAEQGRVAWQQTTGYGRRNLVETAIGRYKHLIGPKLHVRTLPGQQGEAALAVTALNRMIRAAKPVSVRRT